MKTQITINVLMQEKIFQIILHFTQLMHYLKPDRSDNALICDIPCFPNGHTMQ